MKLTIQKISKVFVDKQNKPLVDKFGNSQCRIGILTDQHGEKWVSGFFNSKSEAVSWKIGDTIEVDIKENGDFTNMYLPKKGVLNTEQLDRIEKKLDTIMQYHGLTVPVSGNVVMRDADSGTRIPARIPKNDEGFPQIDVEEDIKPSDLPF